jgi:hypothetical protein
MPWLWYRLKLLPHRMKKHYWIFLHYPITKESPFILANSKKKESTFTEVNAITNPVRVHTKDHALTADVTLAKMG